MNLKTILDTEIEERSVKLAKLEPGTKEYTDAVEGLAKIMDRRIEIEKLEQNETQNENQLAEERKSRFGKMIVDIGLGLAGIGVTIWATRATFRFEETGTITTQAGRKIIDRIFRK